MNHAPTIRSDEGPRMEQRSTEAAVETFCWMPVLEEQGPPPVPAGSFEECPGPEEPEGVRPQPSMALEALARRLEGASARPRAARASIEAIQIGIERASYLAGRIVIVIPTAAIPYTHPEVLVPCQATEPMVSEERGFLGRSASLEPKVAVERRGGEK